MDSDFYRKLVDLYAGRELPEELEQELEVRSMGDRDLSYDMATLRRTVDFVRSEPRPDFTEESYQRVLMKLYARGGDLELKAPTPAHLQYHLPING